MKNGFLSLLLFAFTLTSIYGQTQATTANGKKVLLNEDGTWEYEKIDVAEPETNMDSSDCSAFISTETDKVTGKSTTGSKETLIISSDGGKSGFGIYMMDISGTVVLSIQAAGGGSCIDDDDQMNVLFRDGSRLSLNNSGKFNCKGKFTLYLGGRLGGKKNLEAFKTKEIETMRIWTSKSYVEKDFTSDESKQFMQTVSCLAEK